MEPFVLFDGFGSCVRSVTILKYGFCPIIRLWPYMKIVLLYRFSDIYCNTFEDFLFRTDVDWTNNLSKGETLVMSAIGILAL